MPPRKRARVAGQRGVEPVAMKDVSPVRLSLRDWVLDMYQSRHGLENDKAKPWPMLQGGSFQEVVQRCWSEMDTLLADSLTFLKLVGMVDETATVLHLQERWMKLKASICQKLFYLYFKLVVKYLFLSILSFGTCTPLPVQPSHFAGLPTGNVHYNMHSSLEL